MFDTLVFGSEQQDAATAFLHTVLRIQDVSGKMHINGADTFSLLQRQITVFQNMSATTKNMNMI
jgi:hypothetical protein